MTFLFLLAYVAWVGWGEGGLITAVVSVASILVFFACVVLHELGHSFMARAFGVRVPRIVLLPIGGMAEFSSLPRRPAQEILIALAGPAVNFVLLLLLSFFTPVPTFEQIKSMELSPLQLLFVMNLMMGTFNLLPAFPMDGGRVLRAIFAQHVSYLKATRWAVWIGKLLALAGIVVMLFGLQHIMGGILFLFILLAGEAEYRTVLRQEVEERQWREFLDRLYRRHPEPPPPS